MAKRSVAKRCLDFCSLFEAELLLELMLRFWKHPFASNPVFRNELLEIATEVLASSSRGTVHFEDIPPHQVNFVNAVWYAECNTLSSGERDRGGKRQAWLDAIRKAIPSCFCAPDHLD